MHKGRRVVRQPVKMCYWVLDRAVSNANISRNVVKCNDGWKANSAGSTVRVSPNVTKVDFICELLDKILSDDEMCCRRNRLGGESMEGDT